MQQCNYPGLPSLLSAVYLLSLFLASEAVFFNNFDGMDCRNDPVVKSKGVPETIEFYGYPVKTHVVDSDGYLLTIFQIPRGINPTGTNCSARIPVIWHHGFLTSPCEPLVLGPQSLPFVLASNCYDVFLVSARSSRYSQRNTNLSIHDPKFWKYSYDELGRVDLRNIIDYILNVTKTTSLYYIGHSMGGAMPLILLHHHPEYNDKIRKMVLLAPACYLRPMCSVLRLAVEAVVDPAAFEAFFDLFFAGALFPAQSAQYLHALIPSFCSPTLPKDSVCTELMYAIAGSSYVPLNKTTVCRELACIPEPVSIRMALQLAQNAKTGNFSSLKRCKSLIDKTNIIGPVLKFGLLPSLTSSKLGTESFQMPASDCEPSFNYNIGNARVETVIFGACKDTLVNPGGLVRVFNELGTPSGKKSLIYVEGYNHFDIEIANDVSERVFNPIYRFFDGNYTHVVQSDYRSRCGIKSDSCEAQFEQSLMQKIRS